MSINIKSNNETYEVELSEISKDSLLDIMIINKLKDVDITLDDKNLPKVLEYLKTGELFDNMYVILSYYGISPNFTNYGKIYSDELQLKERNIKSCNKSVDLSGNIVFLRKLIKP